MKLQEKNEIRTIQTVNAKDYKRWKTMLPEAQEEFNESTRILRCDGIAIVWCYR